MKKNLALTILRLFVICESSIAFASGNHAQALEKEKAFLPQREERLSDFVSDVSSDH